VNLLKERANGEYTLTVVSSDSRAPEQQFLKMKSITIDLLEGSTENSNHGIREDFKLFDKIDNYFPPEEEETLFMMPMIGSGILVVLFGYFLIQLPSNGVNLSNFSFSGLIFTLNYLLILTVIVAFWIEVNLVNTLWILVFLSPFTLISMNMGLSAENCHVTGFGKKVKSQ